MRTAIALIAFICATSEIQAGKGRCTVLVVKNVGAEESPDSVLNRGARDYGPVTQMRVNKKSGRMIFCAHGSYCYAAAAFDFTAPCRFAASPFDDTDDFYYDAQ